MTLEEKFLPEKWYCAKCRAFHWPRTYWLAKAREKLAADFARRLDEEVQRRMETK